MKRTRKKKLKNTIPAKIATIFVGFLVPFYILIFISALSYINSLEEQALETARSVLSVNMTRLDSEMARIDRFYYDLQESNPELKQLTDWQDTNEDHLALYKINQTLRRQNSYSSYSESLYLFLEDQNRLLFLNHGDSAEKTSLLKKSLERSWYIRSDLKWNIAVINDIPYLYHTIGTNHIYMGALIDLDAFMSEIERQLPYEKNEIFLSESEPDGPLDVSLLLRSAGQYVTIRLNKAEIDQKMPRISRIILITGIIVSFILPLFLMLLLIRMINRPTRLIQEGMFRLGSGEPDYRIPDFKASREFVGMKNAFNNMASEIQNLKIRQYEEQLEREEMQLQHLILQIRPHFLINFFNQIFSMAELKDYDGIKKSSLFLSQFFRYLFRSERIATIKSELSLVDSYLELMEERFLDCFTVERDIDESLLSYRIPPLIIQNFVENIFKYAVNEGNIITIFLSLKKENGYAVITIQDDGPGIEEDILLQIREGKPIDKSDGTHIGIYNAAYRLKKLCGEDCILDIQSVLTEGTKVRILLPLTDNI